MSDVTLGTKPKKTDIRDAIHVAVISTTAMVTLRPGQRVGMTADGNIDPEAEAVGIVDPYLTCMVLPGERFWLCLLPNTVTGMRHQWSHPAFDGNESIAWLKDAAMQLGMSYNELIHPDCELVNGEYIYVGSNEHLIDVWWSLQPEFRQHYANVTGRVLTDNDIGGFSCAC